VNGSLLAGDFASGQLPQGPQGIQGQQGIQGLPGTARAYGLVASNGDLSHSFGNPTVSAPFPGDGLYCISVPNVSSSSTPMLVSPGPSVDTGSSTVVNAVDPLIPTPGTNGTSLQSVVEWDTNGSDCVVLAGPGSFQVDTGTQFVRPIDNTIGIENAPASFVFVVP
jgi:hypothetical protein